MLRRKDDVVVDLQQTFKHKRCSKEMIPDSFDLFRSLNYRVSQTRQQNLLANEKKGRKYNILNLSYDKRAFS